MRNPQPETKAMQDALRRMNREISEQETARRVGEALSCLPPNPTEIPDPRQAVAEIRAEIARRFGSPVIMEPAAPHRLEPGGTPSLPELL
jgi:hypothetical protein